MRPLCSTLLGAVGRWYVVHEQNQETQSRLEARLTSWWRVNEQPGYFDVPKFIESIHLWKKSLLNKEEDGNLGWFLAASLSSTSQVVCVVCPYLLLNWLQSRPCALFLCRGLGSAKQELHSDGASRKGTKLGHQAVLPAFKSGHRCPAFSNQVSPHFMTLSPLTLPLENSSRVPSRPFVLKGNFWARMGQGSRPGESCAGLSTPFAGSDWRNESSGGWIPYLLLLWLALHFSWWIRELFSVLTCLIYLWKKMFLRTGSSSPQCLTYQRPLLNSTVVLGPSSTTLGFVMCCLCFPPSWALLFVSQPLIEMEEAYSEFLLWLTIQDPLCIFKSWALAKVWVSRMS